MRRQIAILGLLLLTIAGSACDKSKEFAKNADRIAGYVATGIDIAEKDLPSGSNAQIQTLIALRAVNTINGEITAEAKKYISADGKRLELTGAGKDKLLQILASGNTTIQSLLKNEDFINLPAEKRTRIMSTINDLTETFTVMVELVDAVKTK